MQFQEPIQTLVLCTGNSARSILGEALINWNGKGRFVARSAGSTPAGTPNRYAIDLLKEKGIDTTFARSKSWDEFSGPGAPEFDIVITVCDNAAGEACPVWNGTPIVAHWGIADPAAQNGSDRDIRAAFELAFKRLSVRVEKLLGLQLDQMSEQELKIALTHIGQIKD